MENLFPTNYGVFVAPYLHSALYLLLSAAIFVAGVVMLKKAWAEREAPGGVAYVWALAGGVLSLASIFVFILNDVNLWMGLGTLGLGVLLLEGPGAGKPPKPKRRRRSSRGRRAYRY
jgi:drug/metabolite transporter (DMT)-like permease